MKNKEYQKLLVMALTASLTIGGVGISTMPVWAMENPARNMIMSKAAFETEKNKSEKDTADKKWVKVKQRRL